MSVGFSQKQLEVFKFPYRKNYKILVTDGAIRSGKTVACLLSFILWSMSEFNEQLFGICAKTVRTAERNLIKPLLKIKYLKQNFDISFKRSLGLLEVKRGKKTNTYYIYGGKDEASFNNIQGSTFAGLFLDEVVLMPRSFVEMAMSRCSIENSKIFCTCNPDDPNHWFKKEYIEQPLQKRVLYIRFKMDDNPSLSEQTKQEYYDRYTGVFFKRFILGEWVKAEGIIYELYANNPEKYIKRKQDITDIINQITHIQIGVDFGGNKSKTVFVATGFTRNLKEIIGLRSHKIEGLIDPEQLDIEFEKFAMSVYQELGMPIVSRADNAEPILIRGLQNKVKGNNKVVVKNAKKTSILGRILALNRLFKQERVILLTECNDVIEALKSASWNEKVPNERLDDGSTDIDSLDAFEYSWEEFIKHLIIE